MGVASNQSQNQASSLVRLTSVGRYMLHRQRTPAPPPNWVCFYPRGTWNYFTHGSAGEVKACDSKHQVVASLQLLLVVKMQ